MGTYSTEKSTHQFSDAQVATMETSKPRYKHHGALLCDKSLLSLLLHWALGCFHAYKSLSSGLNIALLSLGF